MNLLFETLNFTKKILRIILPYGRSKLAFLLVSMLAVALLQLVGVASVMPFLAAAADPEKFKASKLGQLLEQVSHITDTKQLIYMTGTGCVLLLFLVNIVSFINQMVSTRYSTSLAHWLRMSLLNGYYKRPYSYFMSRNSSILTKKVNTDVFMFTAFLVAPLCDFLTRLFTTVMLGAGLLWFQPTATICAIILFAIFYLTFIKLSRKILININLTAKETGQNLSRFVQQFLAGMRDIKLRNAGPYFIGVAEDFSSRQAKTSIQGSRLSILPRTMIEPVAFSAIILWAMLALSRGELEKLLPTLGVMAMAGYRILPNLQMLYTNFHLISTNQYTLDELGEEMPTLTNESILKGRQETLPLPEKNLPLRTIEFQNISFRYEGAKKPALENINISLKRGQSLGLVGQTGSGKSTLINLLLGLYKSSSGEILVNGIPLPEKMEEWSTRIGYVPQEIFLWDNTLGKNISFGIPENQIDEAKLKKVIELAQLEDVVSSLPHGLNTEIGERGVRLSGGQRQRIGLARALYFDPEILILDEGTSALDNETEVKFMRAVESLSGDVTIILIAHRLSTVRKCDIIHVLNEGKISESGTYETLMKQGSEFYRLATVSHGEEAE